jgi:aminoglycoside phosphotransferase (APT) family kinase protein
MLPPVTAHLELADLISALKRESRTVDFIDAVRRTGAENVVVESRDGWIFRFPRADSSEFERELAILRRVLGHVPALTPDVEWLGSRTRFMAYRKLTGWRLRQNAYQCASGQERDVIAGSFAEFLAALHGEFTDSEAGELGIPLIDHELMLKDVVSRRARIPESARSVVDDLVEQFTMAWGSDGGGAGQVVVLHNDFHLDNLSLDGALGPLRAVWDFSSVQRGVPTYDFRYFEGDSMDLLRRTARHYERLTGESVDVTAAVVSNRMELVCDLLDDGDEADLPTVIAVWRQRDADG